MIKLNIHEVKTHLSRYLPALEQGETILLCKQNIPIAEIRPLPKQSTLPRPFGLAADRGVELPADLLRKIKMPFDQ